MFFLLITVFKCSLTRQNDSADHYTFGHATDGGHNLRSHTGYTSMKGTKNEINDINTLDKTIETEKAFADEVQSVKEYYNGEKNLNSFKIICKELKNPKGCHDVTHCGWCGQTKSCVEGTKKGPIEDCSSSTYSYN